MSGRRDSDNKPDIRGGNDKPKKSEEEKEREMREKNDRLRRESPGWTTIK